MLLSSPVLYSLNSIEKIRPRLIISTFNGNLCTTVVSCYSPTNVSDECETTSFYDELSSLTRQVPKHNVFMIGGDMNVKLGHIKVKNTNRNGKYLQNLITENSLCCLNKKFRKKCDTLWTHRYQHGVKAQLGYMLVNRKWINSLMNCEAYGIFEGVSSDHRTVSVKLRLSLQAKKPKVASSPRYDW